MNISITRIGDKFSIRFDVIGLDGCMITNTLEVGWQEADEIRRLLGQHIADWHFERDPSHFKEDEVLPF